MVVTGLYPEIKIPGTMDYRNHLGSTFINIGIYYRSNYPNIYFVVEDVCPNILYFIDNFSGEPENLGFCIQTAWS